MPLLEGRDHAGVCRLCRQVAKGTKGNEPEEKVRESTMTTAGECKIQKRACCDPAKKNSKEKKNSLYFKVSFVINMALSDSHLFLSSLMNEVFLGCDTSNPFWLKQKLHPLLLSSINLCYRVYETVYGGKKTTQNIFNNISSTVLHQGKFWCSWNRL